MQSAFASALTLLAVLLLADVHQGALSDGPILQGWLAVLLHAAGLACFGFGGALLGGAK